MSVELLHVPLQSVAITKWVSAHTNCARKNTFQTGGWLLVLRGGRLELVPATGHCRGGGLADCHRETGRGGHRGVLCCAGWRRPKDLLPLRLDEEGDLPLSGANASQVLN